MATAIVRGQFVWHDLLTPNPAGAHEFYGKAVGWKTQRWEKDPSYLMFAAPSGPVGGAVEARNATPQWVAYISTADVDATTEAATRLGARVQTPPTALPNGGRYAMLIDPQGALFGIHASSGGAEAAPAAPQAGQFSWHELATNVAPSIAFGFYGALFDWDEISEHDMGPMGMYLTFGRSGQQFGGMFDKGAAGKPGPAYWLGYVNVADLEGTLERAKAARGSVLTGPMDVPGGDRIAQLMDPYGAFFALHKTAVETAATGGGARKPAKKSAASKPPARTTGPNKKRPAKKAAVKRAKAATRATPKKKPAAKKKTARTAARAKARTTPKKKTKKTKKRR